MRRKRQSAMDPTIPRRRVLIVEDEPTVQTILAGLLEDEGYACRVCADGREALAAVAEAMPDLVVLDLLLPGLDGWGFLAAYRRLAPPRAPVLVTSSQPAPAGDDVAYVARPFDMDELMAVVRRLVAQN